MTPRGKGDAKNNPKAAVGLDSAGLQEIMDLLKLADQSVNPEIRAAAVEIARETSKHRRKQVARVSPAMIICSSSIILGVAAAASWYAVLNYPDHIAWELSGIVITLALIGICLYALVSGHLSQANFVGVMRMCIAKLPRGGGGKSLQQLSDISAQTQNGDDPES